MLKELGSLLRVLERLLGGSREALGRLLEASKRYLGPKTVTASFFGQFFCFLQKSSKKSSYYGLWSKIPLRSLQELSKSLPRAVQGPSRSTQEHPRAVSEAPKRRPRAFKRHLTQGEETQVVRLQNMKLTATQFPAKPRGGLSLPT